MAQWCRSRGSTVTVTREPGGGRFGAAVRDLLLHGEDMTARAEALLFAADRADHVAAVVRPALQRGEIVITDRYIDSSVAYQGAGRELGVDWVRSVSLWATEGLRPALTVVLDVPVAVGQARLSTGPDRMESQDIAFHARVRQAFRDLSRADPRGYLVVDATLPKADVAERIRRRVDRLLLRGDDGRGEDGRGGGGAAPPAPVVEPWGTP